MSRFLDKRLDLLEAYVPGEQPKDKAYVKLNTNESPFPPSPSVIAAVGEEEIKDLRLYCDPECKKLRMAIAELYGVGERNVFLSNGSDDILNFSFMAFGHKGAAFADITYGFYKVFAELYGIETEIIPLREDFSLDVDRFISKNKLVVIANPNAPTGLEESICDIEKIITSNPDSIVVVDEAYVDFGARSTVELVKKYDNLICVQTFSKSRSMAGARLGFAIASENLVSDLEKIKYSTNPYNINRLTQILGCAAINENQYYMDNCKKIEENRKYTTDELERLGFSVLPSKANFVFAKSDRISGAELYKQLKTKGVLIRHFEKERIKDYNRITIGSREEMEIFIARVKEILGEE